MLATELGLSEDTVTTMFKGGSLGEYSNSTEEDQKLPLLSRDNPEGYFLALLLKADIDIMREYAYKMDVEDFINPIVVNIYEALVGIS
ncbi:MAG: hypothetical protein UW33_C0008G0041 [candidate division WWE3 bacterium GW2011_GWF1_44_14]|nr:MAG: hypothetical protein UW33_C0008G0041 [candidate division WWE3 bacterium GW2011_GWF1_44_14]